MSLRSRILALGVGSAAAMLLLLAVPVTLALRANVVDDAQQRAVSVVQGVADLVSTGRADSDDLAVVVDRLDERESGGVTVARSDGTSVGVSRP
ncbi:MAG: hypothetical protein EOO67_12775, partial [Microbacterium sp.]